MKRRILAAALLFALSATQATAATTYRTFRCSNSTVLRVIFDNEAGTATVVPFGRPSIRLRRAESGGERFRYVRRNTQELSGTMEEVEWRTGSARWTCRRVGG